jgi:hypothetical protein
MTQVPNFFAEMIDLETDAVRTASYTWGSWENLVKK